MPQKLHLFRDFGSVAFEEKRLVFDQPVSRSKAKVESLQEWGKDDLSKDARAKLTNSALDLLQQKMEKASPEKKAEKDTEKAQWMNEDIADVKRLKTIIESGKDPANGLSIEDVEVLDPLFANLEERFTVLLVMLIRNGQINADDMKGKNGVQKVLVGLSGKLERRESLRVIMGGKEQPLLDQQSAVLELIPKITILASKNPSVKDAWEKLKSELPKNVQALETGAAIIGAEVKGETPPAPPADATPEEKKLWDRVTEQWGKTPPIVQGLAITAGVVGGLMAVRWLWKKVFSSSSESQEGWSTSQTIAVGLALAGGAYIVGQELGIFEFIEWGKKAKMAKEDMGLVWQAALRGDWDEVIRISGKDAKSVLTSMGGIVPEPFRLMFGIGDSQGTPEEGKSEGVVRTAIASGIDSGIETGKEIYLKIEEALHLTEFRQEFLGFIAEKCPSVDATAKEWMSELTGEKIAKQFSHLTESQILTQEIPRIIGVGGAYFLLPKIFRNGVLTPGIVYLFLVDRGKDSYLGKGIIRAAEAIDTYKGRLGKVIDETLGMNGASDIVFGEIDVSKFTEGLLDSMKDHPFLATAGLSATWWMKGILWHVLQFLFVKSFKAGYRTMSFAFTHPLIGTVGAALMRVGWVKREELIDKLSDIVFEKETDGKDFFRESLYAALGVEETERIDRHEFVNRGIEILVKVDDPKKEQHREHFHALVNHLQDGKPISYRMLADQMVETLKGEESDQVKESLKSMLYNLSDKNYKYSEFDKRNIDIVTSLVLDPGKAFLEFGDDLLESITKGNLQLLWDAGGNLIVCGIDLNPIVWIGKQYRNEWLHFYEAYAEKEPKALLVSTGMGIMLTASSYGFGAAYLNMFQQSPEPIEFIKKAFRSIVPGTAEWRYIVKSSFEVNIYPFIKSWQKTKLAKAQIYLDDLEKAIRTRNSELIKKLVDDINKVMHFSDDVDSWIRFKPSRLMWDFYSKLDDLSVQLKAIELGASKLETETLSEVIKRTGKNSIDAALELLSQNRTALLEREALLKNLREGRKHVQLADKLGNKIIKRAELLKRFRISEAMRGFPQEIQDAARTWWRSSRSARAARFTGRTISRAGKGVARAGVWSAEQAVNAGKAAGRLGTRIAPTLSKSASSVLSVGSKAFKLLPKALPYVPFGIGVGMSYYFERDEVALSEYYKYNPELQAEMTRKWKVDAAISVAGMVALPALPLVILSSHINECYHEAQASVKKKSADYYTETWLKAFENSGLKEHLEKEKRPPSGPEMGAVSIEIENLLLQELYTTGVDTSTSESFAAAVPLTTSKKEYRIARETAFTEIVAALCLNDALGAAAIIQDDEVMKAGLAHTKMECIKKTPSFKYRYAYLTKVGHPSSFSEARAHWERSRLFAEAMSRTGGIITNADGTEFNLAEASLDEILRNNEIESGIRLATQNDFGEIHSDLKELLGEEVVSRLEKFDINFLILAQGFLECYVREKGESLDPETRQSIDDLTKNLARYFMKEGITVRPVTLPAEALTEENLGDFLHAFVAEQMTDEEINALQSEYRPESPGTAAFYELAKYFGFTGRPNEEEFKSFFTESLKGVHGVYWSESERVWYSLSTGATEHSRKLGSIIETAAKELLRFWGNEDGLPFSSRYDAAFDMVVASDRDDIKARKNQRDSLVRKMSQYVKLDAEQLADMINPEGKNIRATFTVESAHNPSGKEKITYLFNLKGDLMNTPSNGDSASIFDTHSLRKDPIIEMLQEKHEQIAQIAERANIPSDDDKAWISAWLLEWQPKMKEIDVVDVLLKALESGRLTPEQFEDLLYEEEENLRSKLQLLNVPEVQS